jgi:hypothetical protein
LRREIISQLEVNDEDPKVSVLPPTHPQPHAKVRVKSSFFLRGQLYGSFGDSDGWGTKTI